MKKYIFLILIIFLISCEKHQEVKYRTYCLEVELVTGKIKKLKLRAPIDCSFFIREYKGSYWLEGSTSNFYFKRAGVIDFELCN